jgi:hypothetical protein
MKTNARTTAESIRRAAGPSGRGSITALAKATTGVEVTIPDTNADVVQAGLAYATGLWWLAASGQDIRRADVRDFAQAIGDELMLTGADAT